ncbi:MAG: hypothetical protein S4CHLAM81_00060 [Chlamydiales bacterium]|nr:hypothetical protein [Chlamydiales bacterium]MCH9634810.1 hypothetical protein [Chlamydiales bacterium]MCH9703512.1 hypothetical protein [Chlamydiota bacterium]
MVQPIQGFTVGNQLARQHALSKATAITFAALTVIAAAAVITVAVRGNWSMNLYKGTPWGVVGVGAVAMTVGAIANSIIFAKVARDKSAEIELFTHKSKRLKWDLSTMTPSKRDNEVKQIVSKKPQFAKLIVNPSWLNCVEAADYHAEFQAHYWSTFTSVKDMPDVHRVAFVTWVLGRQGMPEMFRQSADKETKEALVAEMTKSHIERIRKAGVETVKEVAKALPKGRMIQEKDQDPEYVEDEIDTKYAKLFAVDGGGQALGEWAKQNPMRAQALNLFYDNLNADRKTPAPLCRRQAEARQEAQNGLGFNTIIDRYDGVHLPKIFKRS